MSIRFPNVPNLPGVPAVLRGPLLAQVATLAAPIIGGFLDSFAPVWDILDSGGNSVIAPDTFLGIEYQNTRSISSYPLEAGSFASYNKVNDPFRATVRMATGGTLADREGFLADMQRMADSLDLYTIVTPEGSYSNVNLERFDYRREARNGANMIIVAAHFVEIRQAAPMAYSSLVPQSLQTNPATSTGMPDPVASPPQAQSVQNLGGLSPSQVPPTVASQITANIIQGVI
jgi:hypothetical protein